MTQFPTIYKRDTKGKVREWRMEVDGDQFRTIAGLQEGQQVTSEWTIAKGKNTGRANETSAEEQAVLEVEALYKKKLKVDYHEDQANIDVEKIYKPMLAKKWEDRKAKINWSNNIYVQPKLDGIRCIVMKSGAWSRTGKPIVAIPHILEALAPVFEKFPNAVLDGELYNHDLKADFNKIVSMVKRVKVTDEDLELSARMAQYHIYDFPSMGDLNFRERIAKLGDMFLDLGIAKKSFQGVPGPNDESIQLVETLTCFDEATVDLRYAEFLGLGYEGGIIRVDGPYEQKRSWLLLKRKDFDDAEFEIVDIEEGKGNWSGVAKRVIFRHATGLGKAGLKGSKDYARHVLENRKDYIGKQATIQYFGMTPDGEYRFPIAKVLHEDERW